MGERGRFSCHARRRHIALWVRGMVSGYCGGKLVVSPANGHIYLKALLNTCGELVLVCLAHIRVLLKLNNPHFCLVLFCLSPLSRVQDIFRRLTNPTLKKLYRFVLKRLVGRFLHDDIALEV